MKERDNFLKINSILKFESEDDFYYLQIIQRNKDTNTLGTNSRCIKTYYIKSNEEFMRLKDDIIHLCHCFNARAYINLNVRSFKKVTLGCLKAISDRIISNDYTKPYKIFDSITGQSGASRDKSWIIDVDCPEDMKHTYIMNITRLLESCEPFGEKIKAFIDTRNGFHIITSTFNLNKFKECYPDIDIHKNNPTLLYAFWE